jgi:hypothetical protein
LSELSLGIKRNSDFDYTAEQCPPKKRKNLSRKEGIIETACPRAVKYSVRQVGYKLIPLFEYA